MSGEDSKKSNVVEGGRDREPSEAEELFFVPDEAPGNVIKPDDHVPCVPLATGKVCPVCSYGQADREVLTTEGFCPNCNFDLEETVESYISKLTQQIVSMPILLNKMSDIYCPHCQHKLTIVNLMHIYQEEKCPDCEKKFKLNLKDYIAILQDVVNDDNENLFRADFLCDGCKKVLAVGTNICPYCNHDNTIVVDNSGELKLPEPPIGVEILSPEEIAEINLRNQQNCSNCADIINLKSLLAEQIQHVESLKARLTALEESNQSIETQLQLSEEEALTLKRDNRLLQENLAHKQNELVSSQKDFADLQKQFDAEKQRLQDLIFQANNRRDCLLNKLNKLQSEADPLRDQLAEAQLVLQSCQKKELLDKFLIAKINQDNKAKDAKIHDLEAQIKDLQNRLNLANSALEEQKGVDIAQATTEVVEQDKIQVETAKFSPKSKVDWFSIALYIVIFSFGVGIVWKLV